MTPQPKNAAYDLVELTTDLVSAYVSNNPVPLADLPSLIEQVHQALSNLETGVKTSPPEEKPVPAVPIKKSITPDYLICLENGKKFKSLKRHLSSQHGMTPDEYRAKWNLPADYPMVAPGYAAARSQLAKEMGLGRKKNTRKRAA
ncbi:MucR family transcriptional regulator [Pseudochrobactrum sp. sp1633]|uniref:MucR family transcriptional regulator n=1 Tax=Pseudochrobactrum sp. sp1633 TaxID=3036706 RepID=UPI0025A4DEB6|nr:MucR family transcriptional regulator [Pseudochrobactrum sp. sp1633]MDM8347039.1 MucR family transcriptional regulator [Pseudochrobactrum sp. sp1633]